MKPTQVKIEYIQNQVSFPESEEFVVIFNGTRARFDLQAWKLIYEDLVTGAPLHTHHFYKLKGSFDPGERICVLSGEGSDRFQKENSEATFPGPHWDLYTDVPRHLLNLPRVRLQLV